MFSVGKLCLPWAGPVLLVALAGCGGDPKVVKVTGTLTYKQKPVTNAILTFLPDKGRQSWAETDEQGRFKINYDRHQDGAVVGKHKVWVEFRPTTQAEQEAVMMGKPPPLSGDPKTFFNKYSQANSKVEVMIDTNTKELKLDWD